MTSDAIKIAALYKFVTLAEPDAWRAPLAKLCNEHEIKGTLLLAHEGINGTVAGSHEAVDALLDWLRSHVEFGELDAKFSYSAEQPFLRMKVRLKKEIVTLGVEGVDPSRNAGTYVEPQDWNALIADPDVIVVDTRNDYEVGIGTFKGALNPQTKSFGDLPDWVDEKLDVAPDTKIAMFCTGGIRCEKSTALLKAKGFDNVFHLKGGILKYLEEVPQERSLWEGECFVFDSRVSVGHGLVPGPYDQCRACGMPISQEDKAHAQYSEGVSCHHCYDAMSDEQRARFADRQRQINLARQRKINHLGADLKEARARKRAEKELQRRRSHGEVVDDQV
ncbi:rhodanese-related sulfurtransferase [Pseudahrensia aquimaris]|uniref:tRNA uridine(34) hydroxylase n=1 Tax=Pseudahrensia aquimaris TaxID=744461 RepID=A0ABW3FKM3_9HYPH